MISHLLEVSMLTVRDCALILLLVLAALLLRHALGGVLL